MRLPTLTVLAAATALIGAAPAAVPAQAQVAGQAPAPCTPSGAKLQFICGVPNPEDLVRVPGSDWIIASSLTNTARPGSGGLYLVDPAKRTATKVALQPQAKALAPYDRCPGPLDLTRFSSHGLNIQPASGARSMLYAVGHGGREAIEVFEVVRGRGAAAPSITWVGCIAAPAGANFNSVTALSQDRVIATDFYHAPLTMQDALAGRNTGAVYTWRPGAAGFEKLPGTDLPGPNGVEVSLDRRYLFVAVTGTSSVMRYELAATEKPPVATKTDFRTDNLRWGPGGKLLLAGPGADPDCKPGPGVRCPMASVVGSLDPQTLALTMLLKPTAEPGFQGLSSALVVGRTLWLGSYSADRIAYTTLAP